MADQRKREEADRNDGDGGAGGAAQALEKQQQQDDGDDDAVPRPGRELLGQRGKAERPRNRGGKADDGGCDVVPGHRCRRAWRWCASPPPLMRRDRQVRPAAARAPPSRRCTARCRSGMPNLRTRSAAQASTPQVNATASALMTNSWIASRARRRRGRCATGRRPFSSVSQEPDLGGQCPFP